MPNKVLGHQPADLSGVMPMSPEVTASHNGDFLHVSSGSRVPFLHCSVRGSEFCVPYRNQSPGR